MMIALCACLVYLFFHDKAAQLTVMQQGQNRIWEERHSVAGPLCSFPHLRWKEEANPNYG